MAPLTVRALIPLLATACSSAAECWKSDPPPVDADVEVTAEELAQVLDKYGSLGERACTELCELHVPAEEVLDCEFIGDGDQTTAAVPAPPDSGDTGADVAATVHCHYVAGCIGGRDHASVDASHAGRAATLAGAWLAAQAHAEATSVRAFVALAAELERAGAPPELVERCRVAAREEVRHARLLGRMARSRGGAPAPIRFVEVAPRSAVALAVENAVEGCVRETWSALLAAWQAQHAAGAADRRVFRSIAADEAGHAEIAWDIDRWLRSVLSADEVAQVDRARADAAAELLATVGTEPEVPELGLPTPAEARNLARTLAGALWA